MGDRTDSFYADEDLPFDDWGDDDFDDYDDPCQDCAMGCDGYEAAYCCLRCQYLGQNDCDRCDRMDI